MSAAASRASLKALSNSYEPYLQTTVSKWSDKVSAASSASLKSKTKFNKNANSALNQNTWTQIQNVIANDGDRLVARTRVPRTSVKVIGSIEEDVEEGKKEDEELFDDTDFYQALLKDVVDNQFLDLGPFVHRGAGYRCLPVVLHRRPIFGCPESGCFEPEEVEEGHRYESIERPQA